MSLEVNVTKRFDGFTLHAAFTAGDTATALLGASGCGKSMTLRCIAGIVRPDEGRIVLDGQVLFDSAQGIDLPPQQRNVGLLFQNYALFPNMTVEQNILCALKKEKDPAARRAACAEALRAMRLEELAKRLPGALSGGQQQRFDMFSDVDSRISHLNKIGQMVRLLCLANLLIGVTNTFSGASLAWLNLLCATFLAYGLGRISSKRESLAEERQLHE